MALAAGAGLARYGDEPLPPPPPKGDGRGGSLYGGGGGCLEPPNQKKRKEKRKKGNVKKNRFKKSFKIRPLFLFGAQIPIPITSRRARKDASTSQQPWAFISGLNY